jgi:hypothetical protein
MAMSDFDAQVLQLSRRGVRGVLFQSPVVPLVVKGPKSLSPNSGKEEIH